MPGVGCACGWSRRRAFASSMIWSRMSPMPIWTGAEI